VRPLGYREREIRRPFSGTATDEESWVRTPQRPTVELVVIVHIRVVGLPRPLRLPELLDPLDKYS